MRDIEHANMSISISVFVKKANLKQLTKMIRKTVICAIVIQLATGLPDGISSKLDFGNSESSTSNYDSTLSTSLVKALVQLRQATGSSKGIVSSKIDQNPFNLRSIAPLAQKSHPVNDFSSLGVVCVDGSCNTTDLKTSSDTEDKLSTDILVQVVTNVQGSANKSVIPSGTDDDIPIVVGYGGINIQENLEPSNRKIDQDVTIYQNPGPGNNFKYSDYGVNTGNDQRPRETEFKHQVPYFEPTFNKHYFGESPPPEFVWHRRQIGYPYNPHAFNTNARPLYKPVGGWQLKSYPTGQHTPSGWTPTTRCTCTNPGLNWYPNPVPNHSTPSSTINDKMDPL